MPLVGEESVNPGSFPSALQACRYILQSSRSSSGRFVPLTPADTAEALANLGFPLTPTDAQGLLEDLSRMGEAVALDDTAGFRWNEARQ